MELNLETRLRTTPEQFLTMVEYMERHGDLSKPVAGVQAKLRVDKLWTDLTEMLNTVGSETQRSADKWKKVWSDWKTKTKKKAARISVCSDANGTPPCYKQILSSYEERVLALMTQKSDCQYEKLSMSRDMVSTPNFPTEDLLECPSPEITIKENQDYAESQSDPLTPNASPRCFTNSPTLRKRRFNNTSSDFIKIEEYESQSHALTSTYSHRGLSNPSRLTRKRRRLAKVSNDFIKIEEARLKIEESREAKFHERELERERLMHERDIERLKIEARRVEIEAQRLEIEKQHNEYLRKLIEIGESLLKQKS